MRPSASSLPPQRLTVRPLPPPRPPPVCDLFCRCCCHSIISASVARCTRAFYLTALASKQRKGAGIAGVGVLSSSGARRMVTQLGALSQSATMPHVCLRVVTDEKRCICALVCHMLEGASNINHVARETGAVLTTQTQSPPAQYTRAVHPPKSQSLTTCIVHAIHHQRAAAQGAEPAARKVPPPPSQSHTHTT